MRRWAPRTTLCQAADNLPVIEASLDERGPLKKRQFDTSQLMDRQTYTHVHPPLSDWHFCNATEAQPYLPFDKPARQTVLGIQDKKHISLLPGTSAHLVDVMPKKRGLLINVGGAVNGLAFAPKRPSADTEPHTEYLAVGCYHGAEDETREIAVTATYKNCIQLWRLRLSSEEPLENTLDVCILHEYGPVLGVDWCPYGAYEETSDDEKHLPKLGLLSAIFGDGSVRIMTIPHPKALRRRMEIQDPNETIYMRLDKAQLVIGPGALFPTTHAWGGAQRLAIGYDNGRHHTARIKKEMHTQ
ncbi:hypothetical protein BCR43DRAFT_207271 [Syncephalastrum racemosum]|uniref:Uncharacterized protein n=1 Tax=Syncephalastrum racemosum TaxID=13706 RepID=A0A1X2HI93_SYNRA|nr:hypothetical protein BCR43DRAFT_207271 [Syncephalastrum racemosum]